MAQIYTNVVRAAIITALNGTGLSQYKYLGWGTGAGTAAVGDTTLFTESAEARSVTTNTIITTTVTNDTLQMVGTITATAGRTITNMGVLDASSAGNLFVKADFTGVPLSTGDAIKATFTYQQT